MDLALEIDEAGRFVCELSDGSTKAIVTVSNLRAADDLLAAVADARETGYGECLWEEQGGEYRWMLRRLDSSLTVVVLWSTGTLTGWEHVFRGDCEPHWLSARLDEELARHGLGVTRGSSS